MPHPAVTDLRPCIAIRTDDLIQISATHYSTADACTWLQGSGDTFV